jgi:hypothetical protein
MAEESWDSFIEEAGDGFNLPPADTYDFVVIAAEGKVSTSGNPMVMVEAKIASGPQAGKTIKRFYVIRMASMAKKFMDNMKAMGITMDVLAQHKPTMQQLAAVMVGKPFRGKIKHVSDEEWGDYAELVWSMKPPTGGAVAVTSFPGLSPAEELGYGSGASVSTADDAAF